MKPLFNNSSEYDNLAVTGTSQLQKEADMLARDQAANTIYIKKLER